MNLTFGAGCKSLAFGSFVKISKHASPLYSQVVFSLQLKTGFYTHSLISLQIFNKSVHQGAFDCKTNIKALVCSGEFYARLCDGVQVWASFEKQYLSSLWAYHL